MKVKTNSSQPKTLKKSLSGTIQKKKLSKPTGTGGVLKNIVKITDVFEDLKAGNDPIGITCSRPPKRPKKGVVKDVIKKDDIIKTSKNIKKTGVKKPKSSISVQKTDKKVVVAPKQKKPKKETIDSASKFPFKSEVHESCLSTNEDGCEPKLDINKVEAAVKGLFTLINSDPNSQKNALWDETIPIHLVITAIKMGNGPKRMIRIALPNSLITDTTDICLIVPDLVRGRNVDHERTYHHYKDLLAEKGIKNIKTILPARQVRVEFNEYEARRNLCHSHDVFLIDQKISGFMVKKLGKEFYIKRKFPITVKLNKKHLKAEIDSKLHKTSFFLDYRGTTKTVQIGHMQQTPRQVAENIVATFNNLTYNYPGGLKNIRCLLLKTPTSESLPIYFSLISRNEIKGPYTKSKTYSKDKEVEGELFGKRVLVKPNGDVVVLSNSEEESDDDDDDDDDNDIKVENNTTKQNNSNELPVEEYEQSDSSVDKEDEKVLVKKERLESDEEEYENDSENDAETEYLMEFEQTKKVQSKSKKKKENKEITKKSHIKEEHLEDGTEENKSRKTKNKKVVKTIAKKKKLNK